MDFERQPVERVADPPDGDRVGDAELGLTVDRPPQIDHRVESRLRLLPDRRPAEPVDHRHVPTLAIPRLPTDRRGERAKSGR